MRVKPRHIIFKLRENGYDINKTALDLGIHKSTVYRWIIRSRNFRTPDSLSTRNLIRKSTKPLSFNKKLTSQNELDIIKLRTKKGFCAEKIKKQLDLNVGRNTIHRFMKQQGLINRYGNHLRPKYQKTKHMHLKNTKTIGYLQMDVKYITPQLSGLPWTCFEFAVIDIFSRYKEAVILNQCDSDGSIIALIEILPKLPFKPLFIQTDNGFEFQGKFIKYLSDIKLEHHFIHKSTPNENAVIERSFRTDEEEFFFRLDKPFNDYDDLRAQFAQYLVEYNTTRPHLGINLETPASVVANVLGH